MLPAIADLSGLLALFALVALVAASRGVPRESYGRTAPSRVDEYQPWSGTRSTSIPGTGASIR